MGLERVSFTLQRVERKSRTTQSLRLSEQTMESFSLAAFFHCFYMSNCTSGYPKRQPRHLMGHLIIPSTPTFYAQSPAKDRWCPSQPILSFQLFMCICFAPHRAEWFLTPMALEMDLSVLPRPLDHFPRADLPYDQEEDAEAAWVPCRPPDWWLVMAWIQVSA